MAGVPVACANPGDHVGPAFILDGTERLQRGDRIGLRVDRLDLFPTTCRVAPVELCDFGLLDVAGVRKHVGAEVDRAPRRQDVAFKSLAHEFGQQSAVVDMGMREQHRVDIGGAEWKGAVVELLERLLSLEQAAIDQEAAGGGLE